MHRTKMQADFALGGAAAEREKLDSIYFLVELSFPPLGLPPLQVGLFSASVLACGCKCLQLLVILSVQFVTS